LSEQGAGYASTGNANTLVGQNAGTATTGTNNTFLGAGAGVAVTTGISNTFIGGGLVGVNGSGSAVTTGSKNTILGNYSGNQGGLDIRTASNFIVLSDGDGNPRQVIDSSGNLGLGVTPSAWSAGGKVIEIGSTGLAVWGNSTANFMFVENAYYNAAWKYASTNGAAYYQMLTNTHAWFNAPSGTAGTNITFTQAMTLDTNSKLGVSNAVNSTPDICNAD
jgi:hypothetical protein